MDFNTAVARMIMCMNDDCDECHYRSLGEICQGELCKECMPVIRKAATSIAGTETADNLEALVMNTLIRVGVPASLLGFEYLKEAIILVVRDSKAMRGVTKVLYPQIALKFNTTVSRVERSIRHAIEVCFDRSDIYDLKKVFGNTISLEKGKCTNSEFISIIAERIKHDL